MEGCSRRGACPAGDSMFKMPRGPGKWWRVNLHTPGRERAGGGKNKGNRFFTKIRIKGIASPLYRVSAKYLNLMDHKDDGRDTLESDSGTMKSYSS